mmetsp:Transcript_64149/g.184258  ORF Transcript_64149/g.184258 Transcript_64149/m.184258 type:complete len:173 (-) Transcript_64149:80-598(-)
MADGAQGASSAAAPAQRWRRRERVHDPEQQPGDDWDQELAEPCANSKSSSAEPTAPAEAGAPARAPAPVAAPTMGLAAEQASGGGGAAKQKTLDPCCICLEEFNTAEEGLPRSCRKCNNSFHQHCLAEWARKEQQLKWEQKPWLLPAQLESGSCPCCRSSKGHDKARRWAKK